MADAGFLDVTVAWSPASREVKEWRLRLPVGASVGDALQASGIAAGVPGGALEALRLTAGVWGRKAALDQPLRQDDRVEVYRDLRVDPKIARRERFQRQGARAAGLFARRKQDPQP